MHTKKLILFCFILFTIFQIKATTYYISSSEGSDNNSGTSPSYPLKSMGSINNIKSKLSPGDSVLFKRGDIWKGNNLSNLYLNINGEPGNHIVFSAYGNGAKPCFNAEGNTQGKFKAKGDYITFSYLRVENTGGTINAFSGEKYADNITLDSLEIDSVRYNSVIFFGDSIIYRRLHITNSGNGGIILYGGGKGSNSLAEYCTIKDSRGDPFAWHDGGVDENGNDEELGNNHIIRYNIIDGSNEGDYGDGNFDVTSGRNIKIYGNIIKDVANGGLAIGHSADNVLVENNFIYFTKNKYDNQGGLLCSSDTVTIRYNYFVNCCKGIDINNPDENIGNTDMKIYNNSFINQARTSIWIKRKDNWGTLILKNNLFYYGGQYFIRNYSDKDYSYSGFKFNNNIYIKPEGVQRAWADEINVYYFDQYQNFGQDLNSRFDNNILIENISYKNYTVINKEKLNNCDKNLLSGLTNIKDLDDNQITDRKGQLIVNPDVGAFQKNAPPKIQILNHKIAFSYTEDDTLSQEIGCANAGLGELEITDLVISDTSKFSTNISKLNIIPGDTEFVKIYYHPDDNSHINEKLEIISNDPMNDSVTIDLIKETSNPELQIDILKIDIPKRR